MKLNEVESICITYIKPLEGNVCNCKYQYVIYRLEAQTYFQSYNNSLHGDMQISSQSHSKKCA